MQKQLTHFLQSLANSPLMIANMMRRLKIFSLALVLGLCCATAMAQDLVVERAIFNESTGDMSLAQIKGAAFQPTPNITARGFNSSAFWLRLKVDVPADPGPLVLSIRPTLVDTVTLFTPQASSQGNELGLNLNERSAQAKTLLDLQPGRQTLYLRVETTGFLFQVKVMALKDADAQNLNDHIKLGGILTVYIFLIFIVLFLMRLRHETFHFFFLIHLLIGMLNYSEFVGFLGPLIPSNWIADKYSSRLIGVANFISFWLLAQSVFGYLNMPRAQRWTRYVVAGFALSSLMLFVIDRQPLLWSLVLFGAWTTLLGSATVLTLALRFLLGTSVVKISLVLLVSALSLFVAAVGFAMLQLVGIFESTQLFSDSTTVRNFFMAIGLIIYLWIQDSEKKEVLKLTQIELAVSDALGRKKVLRLATQSQFMAMLMHELKTPLYIIQIAATSLSRHMALTHPDAKRLDSIARAVDDLNFIIDRCVQADQLDQRDEPLSKTPIALKTLLSEVIHIKGHERISLTSIAEAQMSAQVFTDYQYARIILINLITNALKYSPPESLVQLNVEPIQLGAVPGLNFKVSNTIGSAGRPDPLKVFTRYYRAEGAKKEVGAGLGLWLSHSIAIKLGIELRCRCEADLVHFEFFLELS
jgi:two-component system, sensor histidine kinase LadS